MNILLLLSVFYMLNSNILFVYSDICNPTECFGEISNVFQDADKDSCAKMTQIEQCIGLCYQAAKDNGIIRGIQEIKLDACKDYQEKELHNKCVEKHKYLLLSCLYESFNINAVESNTDPKLLMCRKITEAQDCDISTLVPCSSHADYIAKILLKKLFKPLHAQYCSFTLEEIYKLNVTYPVFANDYKNLALCFDTNSHSVDDCVSHKRTKNSVMSSFFSYKLCKSVESFTNCLQDIVHKHCHKEETTFKMMSHSLYQSVLPKCFPYRNSNEASKENLFNEKYIDSFGHHIKNSSDTLVVYQHLEEQHNSGSSELLFIGTSFVSLLFHIFLIQFLLG